MKNNTNRIYDERSQRAILELSSIIENAPDVIMSLAEGRMYANSGGCASYNHGCKNYERKSGDFIQDYK